MADLSRKRTRENLEPRREPYWQRMAQGAYLGYRRGPETWVARFRGKDGKQQYQALGEALEFDVAKQRAEHWLTQLSASPIRVTKRETVIAALETYATDLRRHGRGDAAKRAEEHFRTAFDFDRKTERYRDPLADQKLEATTKDDFLEWRERLAPGRQARTINRLVRTVTAGLNRAHGLGHVGNPAAWRMESLADDGETETAVFLTPAQRLGLIRAASVEAAAFFRALDLSGARPKELAEAKAADFDGQHLKLSHRKGRPPKLRTRHVVLDKDGVAFFTAQAKNKSPSDPLFTTAALKPWRRDQWAHEMRSAIATHNKDAKPGTEVSTDASAYSFRHSRISELLQVFGVDPLTVAAQTGTSLRMIELTYFKFIRSAMLEKIAGLQAKPELTING